MPFLEITFMKNTILDYIIFASILVIGFIIVKVAKTIIIAKAKAFVAKTSNEIDDFLISLVEKTAVPLLYYTIFYLLLNSLSLNLAAQKLLNSASSILIAVLGIRFIIAIVTYSLETFWVSKEHDPSKKGSLTGIITTIKIIIWGIGITFLLDNLGFKISAVVAGLGIGGIAVALAAQAVLGDLFSYFAIFFDCPFEIGDFIIVGDFMGVVEHVGIKTTRLRSLGGEEIVMANSDLTGSRVRNYKRMQKRRVVFKLGVTYQTTSAQAQAIPGLITSIIKNVPDTTFDRSHFASYGDFALIFETVYYVLSNDYNKYMDVQQEINFKIKEEFEKQGINFAYPTQTVFIEKTQ
ncbi:mechanosensitive ion channel protein MscS [Candidatus Saganbacteria bacterium CG08_land_8_20_14_0_20_45_16]|uniref:Mechanosensitive ion channel protein MscS n=1 Tax=Candidatus Saganbacteria bacterium CG08_land_8_20_14_0_20_45_16 TaxID=2014293 RepID=A0A2H0Y1H6_UNCSA|nr:MAG: mechanosensitive ion channel protein MscS [Candidatus Saganbacteria bacterium CG08_land_8_20_14_0_20_45_16]